MGALGERLKREREKRKITLDDVAKATKISTRMLGAIEEEKFDILPGGMFNKAFVRSYARHLGLDENQAAADYIEAFRVIHPEEPVVDPEAEGRKILEQRVARVQQERPRMERIPWGKAAAALLLFAFAFAVWGSYSRYIKSADRIEAKKLRQAKTEQPRAQQPQPQLVSATAITPSQPITQAVSENSDPPAGSFQVLIKASEESWIHIKADGQDLADETLAAGSQKSVQASSRIEIKAGNIGGLEFWFNGKKLPAQGDLDQVKTIAFQPSGLIRSKPKVEDVSQAIEH